VKNSSTQQKRPVGAPAFQPTDEHRELVRKLAGYGLPHEQIGALVAGGIHRDTLVAHFRQELDEGKASANERIGRTLFEKAMAGDTASLIWWTKAQMRWTSLQQIQVQSEQRISIVSALEQAEGRIIEGELVAPDAVAPGSLGMSGSLGMDDPVAAHDPVARLVPEAAPEGLEGPQGRSQGQGEGFGASDAAVAPRGREGFDPDSIPQFAPRGGEGG